MRKTTSPLCLALLLLLACGDNQTLVPERTPYSPSDEDGMTCLPDLDGRIEGHEIGVALGLSLSYLVSPADAERGVDLEGVVDRAGRRVWDWGADHAADQVMRVAPAALATQWYATHFPLGEFVTPFDAGATIAAVYRRDESGIFLLGLASVEEQPAEGQTLLVYEAPVLLYRFPLEDGARWTSTGTIRNGTIRGLPYAGADVYEFAVDGTGRLVLPDLTFTQVLRVRTLLTLEPVVGEVTSQRQVSFLFECFGEVARATSRVNEADEDFDTAIEVRRLGL